GRDLPSRPRRKAGGDLAWWICLGTDGVPRRAAALLFGELALARAGDLERRLGWEGRLGGHPRQRRLLERGRDGGSLRAPDPLGRRAEPPGLGRQAARVRPLEEVPGGLLHPRRPAGRLDRLLVDPLEPAGLGRLRLRRVRREPPRLDRVRPEIYRRDLRR